MGRPGPLWWAFSAVMPRAGFPACLRPNAWGAWRLTDAPPVAERGGSAAENTSMDRSQSSWPRFGSPMCFIAALVLFPLPFVEIQCIQSPRAYPQPLGKIQRELEFSTVSQSGLQMALGGGTVTKDGKSAWALTGEHVHVWMIVYGNAIAVGLVASLLMDYGMPRAQVLSGCSFAALACLVMQFVVLDEYRQLLCPEPLPFVAERLQARYTIWLYASFAANLIGFGLAVWERCRYGRQGIRTTGPPGSSDGPGHLDLE